MKLRLPLALKAILLACLFNSHTSYATTTPPEGQDAQMLQDGNGTATVTWKPTPKKTDADATEADADGDEEEAKAKEPADITEIAEGATPPVDTPPAITEEKPKRTRVGRTGGRNQRFNPNVKIDDGTPIISRLDDDGLLEMTLIAGKHETITIKEPDTLVFWNEPEQYLGSYFPYHIFEALVQIFWRFLLDFAP